jgi:negative regulator of sigma-B (phosphoserine phosphatase)
METVAACIVECGVAFRARPGESGCGDIPVFVIGRNRALVAALDGLGHGEEAVVAAKTASSCLEAHAHEPLETLLTHCHRALDTTRGAVISVATFDCSRDSMAWLGVGNVQGVLLRRQPDGYREETLLLRSGVVGSGALPAARAEVLRVVKGDTLIFATDGIDRNFGRDLAAIQAPQRAAESILARYARKEDDALVVVARYIGKEPKRAKTPTGIRRQRSGS